MEKNQNDIFFLNATFFKNILKTIYFISTFEVVNLMFPKQF